MTIIAWDGKTMAADKQSTNCGYGSTVTKIYRVPGGIVGFTGNEGHAMALLGWFRSGQQPGEWPKKPGEESASVIFAMQEGLFVYSGEDGPNPIKRECPFGAWGAGRDYALAAMHLGKSAKDAVRVACALDTQCGKGIDCLKLEGDGDD